MLQECEHLLAFAQPGGSTMRFLIPKPLHGWRAFAGEVGIIVIGVLIALGAQQVAQNVQERGEARDAEQAIRGELEHNMALLRSRAETKACVDARIAELQALIDSAQGTGGAIKTPSWVGRPQFWTMQMARWQASSQAGRAALLRADELALYGSMYSYMTNVNAAMAVEQDDWARLRSLEHLGRLTPEMAFELNTTLQQARYINWRINVWTIQLRSLFDRLHLKVVVVKNIPASRSACVPMNTPRDQAVRESNSYTGDEP
jgi:hypothetical protein